MRSEEIYFTCCELQVRTLDNSSVEVFWTRSWSSSNASCFSGLRLTWWTNHSKGLYFEKALPVEDEHTRSVRNTPK